MLHAHKAALSNTLRTRMVALRQQELEYYTNNCRLLGDQGALVAGFAFSGIRYHQFAEQQEGWYLTSTETLEENIYAAIGLPPELKPAMCITNMNPLVPLGFSASSPYLSDTDSAIKALEVDLWHSRDDPAEPLQSSGVCGLLVHRRLGPARRVQRVAQPRRGQPDKRRPFLYGRHSPRLEPEAWGSLRAPPPLL